MQDIDKQRNATLDGLRGIAALMVVASHLGNHHLPLIPGLDFSGIGKYGVYLFFTLSAFLLTDQLLRYPLSAYRQFALWRGYFIRRTLRIFPLYFIVLIASWFWRDSPWLIGLDGRELLAHLSLQQGKDIFWSVPVEFKYYFLIPPIALVARYLARFGWSSAVILLVIAIAFCTQIWPADQSIINGVALGDYLPVFLCGSLAAVLLVARSDNATSAPGKSTAFHLAACAIVLLVAALTPAALRGLGIATANDVLHRAYLLFGLLWGGLLYCLHQARGALSLIFGWSVLVFCGRVSFSIYLLHMIPLRMLAQGAWFPSFSAWLVLVATLGIAALSFLFIEQPFIRIGQKCKLPAQI